MDIYESTWDLIVCMYLSCSSVWCFRQAKQKLNSPNPQGVKFLAIAGTVHLVLGIAIAVTISMKLIL
jgi:hypothetical protein